MKKKQERTRYNELVQFASNCVQKGWDEQRRAKKSKDYLFFPQSWYQLEER